MADTKNIITFLDSLNRCIFAERIPEESTDTILVVKNPVVVNVSQQRDQHGQPTGQMALQLVPIFFREFLADTDAPSIFKYNRSGITEMADTTFNFKLYAQYEQIFMPTSKVFSPQAPAAAPAGQVIKLFD